MRVTAVIGSAWGDEGKGLMTDYFSTPDSTVVRFNGGAQAGHTVVRDGVRYVFSHFGSGTLRGATTFLSRFFIVNPWLFQDEHKKLTGYGLNPVTFVDPRCLVTTPYDVIINMMVEEHRGNARHGSCGVGINETIKRNEAGFTLTAQDLLDDTKTLFCLQQIVNEWVPSRLKELGMTNIPNVWLNRLNSEGVRSAFMEQNEYFFDHTTIDLNFPKNHLVFEGAQGLLLDQDHEWFPHVTHSKTGLHNVVDLANEFGGIDGIDAVYVTRAYATRHGNGPFPRENSMLRFEDATNRPNPWQGSLRFGNLDVDLLEKTVGADYRANLVRAAKRQIDVTPSMAVTCLDQIDQYSEIWRHGVKRKVSESQLIESIFDAVASVDYMSFGPSANYVYRF